MKAISTVIASILMLMIVVALGGTTYLYISGIFTGKTATAFEIIDAVNDTVIIRNSGTDPITSFSSAIVDGNPAVYRVSAQDPSLVGYWKMDETSWTNNCLTPTVIDLAGSNNGKSCPAGTGPTGGATGKFGNAGSFDGVDDYVEVPDANSLDITKEITLEAWIYYDSFASAYNYILDKGEKYPIAIYPNGDWVAFWITTSAGQVRIETSGILNKVSWNHVVGTYDGSKMKIYTNGVFRLEGIQTGDISTDTNALRIGKRTVGTMPFNGLIDEVRIYNRALSEQEIKAHYNIGSQINPGEIATIKIYNTISKGTHTLRLCTSSMCNTVYLTIN